MSNISIDVELEERIKEYLRKIPRFDFTTDGFKNIAYRFNVEPECLQSIVDAVQLERSR